VRVLAALSGGVDSAVAAARAVDAGHEVVGVHMALTRNRAQTRSGSRGCCPLEGFADAHWVLVDYGDVVVHVLQNEDREFYSLERLWKDCPAIELPADLAHEGSQDGDSLGGRETTAS